MPRAGSLWIDGCTLRYIDANGTQRQFTGQNEGTISSQRPGSIWVEGDSICYICASRHKHRVYSQRKQSVSQRAGSAWIESTELRYINQDANQVRAVCGVCESQCQGCDTTCDADCGQCQPCQGCDTTCDADCGQCQWCQSCDTTCNADCGQCQSCQGCDADTCQCQLPGCGGSCRCCGEYCSQPQVD